MANVSIGTVDRVLHNRGEVNEETRQRVQTIIEDLGYMPNILAKSLASKKNLRISVIIPEPNPNNPYWEKPLEGVLRAKSDLSDFNVLVDVYGFSINDEVSFIDQSNKVLMKKPDGVILTPAFQKPSLLFINKCNEYNIPYILIDSNIENVPALSYFGQDAVQSGYLAAKIMSMSLRDKSRVLVMNLANKNATTKHIRAREKGFLQYLQSNKNSKKINYRTVNIDLSDDKKLTGTLNIVLNEEKQLDGIFVTNSRVHLVAKYLQRHQKKDILLVGYDLVTENIKHLNNGTIDFLICQKPEEQGYQSVYTLFNYLISRKSINRINYSPIDIIMKENLDYYLNIKNIQNEEHKLR